MASVVSTFTKYLLKPSAILCLSVIVTLPISQPLFDQLPVLWWTMTLVDREDQRRGPIPRVSSGRSIHMKDATLASSIVHQASAPFYIDRNHIILCSNRSTAYNHDNVLMSNKALYCIDLILVKSIINYLISTINKFKCISYTMLLPLRNNLIFYL